MTGIYKCTKCHHEWQVVMGLEDKVCDWCGAHGRLLSKSKKELSNVTKHINLCVDSDSV